MCWKLKWLTSCRYSIFSKSEDFDLQLLEIRVRTILLLINCLQFFPLSALYFDHYLNIFSLTTTKTCNKVRTRIFSAFANLSISQNFHFIGDFHFFNSFKNSVLFNRFLLCSNNTVSVDGMEEDWKHTSILLIFCFFLYLFRKRIVAPEYFLQSSILRPANFCTLSSFIKSHIMRVSFKSFPNLLN